MRWVALGLIAGLTLLIGGLLYAGHLTDGFRDNLIAEATGIFIELVLVYFLINALIDRRQWTNWRLPRIAFTKSVLLGTSDLARLLRDFLSKVREDFGTNADAIAMQVDNMRKHATLDNCPIRSDLCGAVLQRRELEYSRVNQAVSSIRNTLQVASVVLTPALFQGGQATLEEAEAAMRLLDEWIRSIDNIPSYSTLKLAEIEEFLSRMQLAPLEKNAVMLMKNVDQLYPGAGLQDTLGSEFAESFSELRKALERERGNWGYLAKTHHLK